MVLLHRALKIEEQESEFDQTIVVEFESDVAALKPILPHTFISRDGTYCISALSVIYTDYVGKSTTNSYLAELENMAKITGFDYADILRAMVNQIGHSLSEHCPAPQVEQSPTASALEAAPLPPAHPPAQTPPTPTRERITSKLNSMPGVFSQHDLEYGCTGKVQRHVKLHDETPFKHRARPIHPQDIEAVRKHLRDLLKTGGI